MPTGTRGAAQAAMRALSDLGIDRSRPIDPFAAINQLELELLFQPLRDLLGVIIPGDNPGVLINSDRPASVQRFTAAHEIGHWYLDQDALAIDGHDEVEGNPRSPRERNAQVFAANFLMPLELLFPTAARHGIRKGSGATPTAVYELARDMHVSYLAAVQQLSNCSLISGSQRSQLSQAKPSTAKQALTHGRKPANPRGDVWLLDDAADGPVDIDVFVGDEIVVALHENPSTGYRWRSSVRSSASAAPATLTLVAPEADRDLHALAAASVDAEPTLIEVANDIDAAPAPGAQPVIIGGPVLRRVGFTAVAPGQSELELDYLRPFSDAAPIQSLTINATVRPIPAVEQRRRRLEDFVRSESGPTLGTVR
jgi:Zn-dependent peptidase ImmA (M78 family)/predicted secreted protein